MGVSAGLSISRNRLIRLPESFLNGLVIELIQQFPDCRVELCEAEKGAVPEGRQNPPLHELDPGLYLRFVFWFSDTGGNDRGPIVNRQLLIGAIDAWLIAAGLGNTGEEIVGDQDLGHTANELKSPDMGADPVR